MNVATRADLAAAVTSGRCGLVVVDPQHDFCSERGALAQRLGFDMTEIQQAVGRLNPLIDAWRAAALPVFWVREVFAAGRMRASHRALWGSGDDIWVIKEGSAGADWYAGIVGPKPGESVVTKWHFDAFEDTDLRLLLTARNIDTLLMTGFTTNVCVETTARHAYILGLHVILVTDCCGATSASEHDAAVFNIGTYFGRVTTADALHELLAVPVP